MSNLYGLVTPNTTCAVFPRNIFQNLDMPFPWMVYFCRKPCFLLCCVIMRTPAARVLRECYVFGASNHMTHTHRDTYVTHTHRDAYVLMRTPAPRVLSIWILVLVHRECSLLHYVYPLHRERYVFSASNHVTHTFWKSLCPIVFAL